MFAEGKLCPFRTQKTFLSAQRKQLKPAGVGEGMRMPQKSIWPTRGCIYGQFQFGGELNNASRMIMNICQSQINISFPGMEKTM